LGRILPGPADHENSHPDIRERMDSSHTGKECAPPLPDQKEHGLCSHIQATPEKPLKDYNEIILFLSFGKWYVYC
jgi:hypothetical protein